MSVLTNSQPSESSSPSPPPPLTDDHEKPSSSPTTTTSSAADDQSKQQQQQKKPSFEAKPVLVAVNELAKYNKIKYQFVLQDEIGPAHSKTFYVLLKLGMNTEHEETYTGTGLSIKKAQHNAAEIALKETKFKKPAPRTATSAATHLNDDVHLKFFINNSKKVINNPSFAPTVKLNSLAMKLGLTASYNSAKEEAIKQEEQKEKDFVNNFNIKEYKPLKYQPVPTIARNNNGINLKHQHYQQQLMMNNKYRKKNFNNNINEPQLIQIKLEFANKEFEGTGTSLQLAKHDAASKALEYFSGTPDRLNELQELAKKRKAVNSGPKRKPQLQSTSSANKENLKQQLQPQELIVKEKEKEKEEVENKDNEQQKQQEQEQQQQQTNGDNTEEEIENSFKSDIMLVYEYAHKLNKLVRFELVQESGPSHFKKFVTRCLIEDKTAPNAASPTSPIVHLETTGEGHSKKLSKHDSADKMLKLLKQNYSSDLLAKLSSSSSSTNKQHDNKAAQTMTTKRNRQGPKQQRNNITTGTGAAAVVLREKRKKPKNIEKIKKISPDYGKGSITPISRLMQIQQAKKEKEPIFELISPTTTLPTTTNDNKLHKQEFVMQVTILNTAAATKENNETTTTKLVAEGRGSSKKIAKQNAAEAMLTKLGYMPVPAATAATATAATSAVTVVQSPAQSTKIQLPQPHTVPTVLKPSLRTATAAADNKQQSTSDLSIKISTKDKGPVKLNTAASVAAPSESSSSVKIRAASLNSPPQSTTVTAIENQLATATTTAATTLNDKKVKFVVREPPKMATVISPGSSSWSFSNNSRLIHHPPPKRETGGSAPAEAISASHVATSAETIASSGSKLKIRTQANLHSQGLRQKIQDMQQQLKLADSSNAKPLIYDQKQLEQIFKLAFDLTETLNNKSNEVKPQDKTAAFYINIFEEILQKNELETQLQSQLRKSDFDDAETFEEFSMLVNHQSSSSDQSKATIAFNYKKLLEVLGRLMNFKISFQSLTVKDKQINTYISLSLFSTPEKQLSGQGRTHVESANVASQNALKYLSAKFKQQ